MEVSTRRGFTPSRVLRIIFYKFSHLFSEELILSCHPCFFMQKFLKLRYSEHTKTSESGGFLR